MVYFYIIMILYATAALSYTFKHQKLMKSFRTVKVNQVQPNHHLGQPIHPILQSKTNVLLKFRTVIASAVILTGGSLLKPSKTIAKDYLTQPTEEFLNEERKVTEYTQARQKIRNQWDNLVNHFSSTEKSEELESDLKSLTKLLVDIQDIPIGVKLQSLVKTCRSKKFDPTAPSKKKRNMPYWTTSVEMAYQALVLQFKKVASPANASSGTI